jgi:4-hydroxybenzoate polyprenyltransferase
VPVRVAIGTSTVLIAAALVASFRLDSFFGTWMAAYVALGLGYSLVLSRVPILDLFAQAFLFIGRIGLGAVLIRVPMSHWLLLCGLLLSLFLALARRRHELTKEQAPPDSHAAIHYSPYLVDQMIAVVTSATLLAYTLYTFSPETTAKVGSPNLIYTVPFVLYGIFRYLYVIYQKDTDAPPDWELFLDRPLLINSALYLAVAALVLYG